SSRSHDAGGSASPTGSDDLAKAPVSSLRQRGKAIEQGGRHRMLQLPGDPDRTIAPRRPKLHRSQERVRSITIGTHEQEEGPAIVWTLEIAASRISRDTRSRLRLPVKKRTTDRIIFVTRRR